MNANSKSVRILNIIAAHPEGMRAGEIQAAVWAMDHETPWREMKPVKKYDREKREYVDCGRMENVHRGYWCDGLYGDGSWKPGLLKFFKFFCVKDTVTGRWVRNTNVDHENEPWTVISEAMVAKWEKRFDKS